MTAHSFIYLYARHGDDDDLCRLEMRAFFGEDTATNVLMSPINIEPSRSTFIKGRLEVLFEADNWASLVRQVTTLNFEPLTFKVHSLNNTALRTTAKMEINERRKLEREIGLQINGEPDLDEPALNFGFILIDGHWYFGNYLKSTAVSLRHRNKPHSYSTALSTQLARTVANIAAPFPQGLKVIDPCCGIGNVLIEALSMSFDIVGSDINELVVSHTRENVDYFGYSCDVNATPIADIDTLYDVAIIDMPYNIFTSASSDDQQDILMQARRIAKKVVVVTIDKVDDMVLNAGFTIVDRCEAKKSTFIRQILVCQ